MKYFYKGSIKNGKYIEDMIEGFELTEKAMQVYISQKSSNRNYRILPDAEIFEAIDNNGDKKIFYIVFNINNSSARYGTFATCEIIEEEEYILRNI